MAVGILPWPACSTWQSPGSGKPISCSQAVSLKTESSISQIAYLGLGSHIHDGPIQNTGRRVGLVAPCCSFSFPALWESLLFISCHLTWVLLLTHLLAQLILCPKPSPAGDLSTHPPCSGFFRPQRLSPVTFLTLRLRREIALGKTQYSHIPHLKVREVVPQSQRPQLVLCLQSLPFRWHPDSLQHTFVVGQCHAVTHIEVMYVRRDERGSKNKHSAFTWGKDRDLPHILLLQFLKARWWIKGTNIHHNSRNAIKIFC